VARLADRITVGWSIVITTRMGQSYIGLVVAALEGQPEVVGYPGGGARGFF